MLAFWSCPQHVISYIFLEGHSAYAHIFTGSVDGRIVDFVPLNFLRFNFLSSGGDYYGTHKWHWYFTQGFTVTFLTFLPFCIAGIVQSKRWKLFGLMAWVLGLYSVLGHKEFRFILPVLPVALMFSRYSLAMLENLFLQIVRQKYPQHAPDSAFKNPIGSLFLACNKSSYGLLYEFGSSVRRELLIL